MIFDKLSNLKKYKDAAPYIEMAYDFLKTQTVENFQCGVKEISGKEIYASLQEYDTAPKEGLKWECHRKYIDVQFLLSGEETIYWENTEDLDGLSEYNEEGDYSLSESKNSKYPINLKAGDWLLLFPHDAHKVRCNTSNESHVKKIVVKIKA